MSDTTTDDAFTKAGKQIHLYFFPALILLSSPVVSLTCTFRILLSKVKSENESQFFLIFNFELFVSAQVCDPALCGDRLQGTINRITKAGNQNIKHVCWNW